MNEIIPIEGLNSLIDLYVNRKTTDTNVIESNLNVPQEQNIQEEYYDDNGILSIEEFNEMVEREEEEEEKDFEQFSDHLSQLSEPISDQYLGSLSGTAQELIPELMQMQEQKQEEQEGNVYERIVMNKIKNDEIQKANKRKRGPSVNSEMKKIKREIEKLSKESDFNEAKEKRKKVSVACILCRRSHLSCDNRRPCSRCISKGVPNLCKDAPRKLTNPLKCTACPIFPELTPTELQRKIHKMYELQKQQDEVVNHLTNSKMISPELIEQIKDINSTNLLQYANNMASPNNLGNFLNTSEDDTNIEYDTNLFPIENIQLPAIEDLIPEPNYKLEPQEFHSSIPCVPFTGVTPYFPAKESDSEFNSLVGYCHSVSKRDDMPKRCQTCPFGRVDQFLTELELKQAEEGKEIDFEHLLMMKYKVGLIKPYNYAKGYLKLKSFINLRLSNERKKEMLTVLAKFQENLKNYSLNIEDIDLLMIEETFERLLIKFDRLFASMPLPSCIWRRNGEIFKANHHFAFLVGIPMEKLNNGNTLIYEIMGVEYAMDYWEKFTEIAFDNSQKAIISITALINQTNTNRVIKCSFSFTIYRDKFNIPIAIIGNFIPYDSPYGRRNAFPPDDIIDNIDSDQPGCGSNCCMDSE
ncbi:hypothetical protein BCR36DRAFT_413726 [Piromyces finnis]|uniref:Zn(2)-C6 fungal-type domain-containing protein n=1 Tax=Piromyces finnis TaxID=1754191 RepID=A0A1Y1V5S7_9FUNG|nr:hypothetical protein BCR36DRAFT_413726 [Piromyces finnis]|eukprot:ORX47381.1 hypothetical protein BCR36DRAFT_413726 [Piromyces finnis]